jgi:hypothetical protein
MVQRLRILKTLSASMISPTLRGTSTGIRRYFAEALGAGLGVLHVPQRGGLAELTSRDMGIKIWANRSPML